MADKTIGRVSVKVTPDSSDFRTEAKAKLDAEEKRLPTLDVQLTLTIPKDQIGKVTAQARAIRTTAQAAMNDLVLKVNIDDQASLQAALSSVEREIGRLGAIEIPVGLNEADLKAAKALLQERLREVGVTLSVDLANNGSIERTIAKIDAEMSKLREVQIPVGLNESDLLAAKALLQEQLNKNNEVEIKPVLARAREALVAASLAVLTRAREVEIKPVLNKAALASFSFVSVLSGFSALEESITASHRAVLELFKELPGLMAMVPTVLTIAGGFLSAAANVTGLAGSLAQALPILLALPGIAIGIGTMVFALKDLKKVLPDVASQFKALQPLISGAFWEQAKKPISDLAATVFPLLNAGLKGTASALGGFFAAMSTAIQGAIAGGVLQTWFASLNQSIQIFTSFAPALGQIFQIFGNIGSALLPPLAQVMGELATQFAAFMNNLVAGAGGIGNFVANTIAAFQGIINFVLSLGNVFAAVFNAASAAGAATFQSLADHLNQFAAFLSSPEISQGMTNLFGAAFQLFDNFFAAAGPALQSFLTGVGGVLTTVLPQVGTVLGQVATAFGAIFNNQNALNGLTAFIQGILQGVSALVPALAPVGDLVGALGPTLGLLATQIGKVFGALAPEISTIFTALQPVITLLSNGLASVLTALGPAINQLGQAISQALANPAFAAAISAVVNAVLSLVPALTPLISLAGTLVSALLPIVAAVLAPLAGLISAIVPLLTPLVGVITQIIDAVAPLIPMLVDLLLSVITPLLPILVQLVSAVLPILVPPIQILGDLLKLILPILTTLLNLILPPLAAVLKLVADVIATVLNFAFGLLFDAIGKATGWIDGFTSQLSDFGKFWASVWGDIGDFFVSIWDHIVSFFSDSWNEISGFVTGGITRIKTFFTNGMQALQDLVSNAWDNVVAFFTGGVGNAVSTIAGLPGKAIAALGNIGSTLLGVGKDMIQGFINGITSMAGNIIAAIKHSITDVLPGFVKDALGIHSPSRVFADIGSNLMKGLAGGIESEATTVMRALDGVVKNVAGVAFPTPTASLGVNAGSFGGNAPTTTGNTIIYNAAPGSSISSEEDLFGALGRARAFGF